jgi:hypothetical protein
MGDKPEVFVVEPKDQPYYENKEPRICSCGGIYYRKGYGPHLKSGEHNVRMAGKRKNKKFGLF